MSSTLNEKKCLIGLKVVLHLALLIPNIIFFTIAINNLINSSPILDNCPNSLIYWYVFGSTIYYFLLLCFILSLNITYKLVVSKYIIFYLILIGLTIWGSYEINTRNCNDSKDYSISNLADSILTSHLFLVITTSIINACIICVKSVDKYSVYQYKKSREKDTNNSDDN
tara:strand:+ start:572 stop:1078 length:507 start_codon:yes stop_codon:yes gene_type:complete